jgi:signal transduction histidine kinase
METLRVLVTDDEFGMRRGVERTLREFSFTLPDVAGPIGFSVDQAESGEVALEKIQAEPPDILLLDHKMPGISGLDVLDRLAGMKLDMLTIMITAYASIETAVTATKRGAYDFLAKPFTPDELRSTVRKAAARLILAKQTRRLAEEKRQVRFEFIRVLGHELKAPLNAVEGYLSMFGDQTLGADLNAYGEVLQRCHARLDGMRKLVDDLLDLTHIESGRKSRQLEPVCLQAVAQSALETVAGQAAARGIAVRLCDGPPVTLSADRGELQMIFNNLISNAVKYNRDGGTVEIRLQRQEDSVRLAVTDTGIGMSEDERSQLFQEFVRIKNDKTREILGSGLGLSIVAKLAALYRGSVAVESRPDAGSTFTVTLHDASAGGA